MHKKALATHLAVLFLVNLNLAKESIMPFGKIVKVAAEAVKKAGAAASQQATAPRGGRGFGAAILNALQQMPQAAGAPRRRGLPGIVAQAAQAAQAARLKPTAIKIAFAPLLLGSSQYFHCDNRVNPPQIILRHFVTVNGFDKRLTAWRSTHG